MKHLRTALAVLLCFSLLFAGHKGAVAVYATSVGATSDGSGQNAGGGVSMMALSGILYGAVAATERAATLGDYTLRHFYVTFKDTSCVHMKDAAARKNINVYDQYSAVVTAIPCDPKATVSGTVGDITLALGENSFNTVVTAQNGVSMNYSFVIYVRQSPTPRSTDSLLSSLELSWMVENDPQTGARLWERIELEPSGTFDPNVLAYTAYWPTEETSIRIEVAAVARDSHASVAGCGEYIIDYGPSTTMSVTVTAQDAVTRTTYTIEIRQIFE